MTRRLADCSFLLLVTMLLLISRSGWTEELPNPDEIEVTGEFTSSVEPQLTDATKAAQLEIYDRLAFGKGRLLRIDGKSRKNAVLMLEGQSQSLVRLFDLPEIGSNVLSTKTDYYFGGVLSKIERTSSGVVEVTLTYANLSEVAGRFYSRQAKEFVQRTGQLRGQNQRIADQPSQTVAANSQTSSTSTPARPSSSSSTSNQNPQSETPGPSAPVSSAPPQSVKTPPRAETPKTQKEDSEEKDDEEPLPRNRPVLKRRVDSDKPPAEAEPSKGTATPEVRQSSADDDVVIYRRRDGSRRPSAGVETAPPPVENSDRPVLRRKSPNRVEEREVDGMLLIPEGSVALGSEDPADRDKPLHRVTVKSFYLDKHEVSNEDYRQFCEATGRTVPPYWEDKRYPRELEKHPVVQVSWLDASAYARWAGKRLPTEAEWERAAKGPNSYHYAYGNTYDPEKANTNKPKTSVVGSYPANEFGLFDMTGNVLEWTSSLYLPYPYQESDGREASRASGARVLRGGSYSSNERDARCLVRQKDLPENGSPETGFRCARDFH